MEDTEKEKMHLSINLWLLEAHLVPDAKYLSTKAQ